MRITMKTDSAKDPYEHDILTMDSEAAGYQHATCVVTIQPKDGPPAVAVVLCDEMRRMVDRLP